VRRSRGFRGCVTRSWGIGWPQPLGSVSARLIKIAVPIALVAVGGCVPTAHAVFPGENGRIAFVAASWLSGCGDCDPDSTGWTASRGARPAAISSEASQLAFSPNGRWLAFARSGNIYVSRPDGSRRRPVTGGFLHQDSDPAWSPQRDKLAFSRFGRYGQGLFVVGARGGAPRRLLSTTVPMSDLAWAPSGAELAFASYGFSDQAAVIRSVALDGALRELGSGWHVSWSAAGWLAYERADGLYVARPGSAPERRLVARRQQQPDPSYGDLQPHSYTWSPEGKRIALTSGGRIHVARAAGGEARPISPRGACCPQWSPDGRLVAFVRGRRIYVAPAWGGRSRLFTRVPGPGCLDCEKWVAGLDWQARPHNR
jgi:Tol biopolymer transport system component